MLEYIRLFATSNTHYAQRAKLRCVEVTQGIQPLCVGDVATYQLTQGVIVCLSKGFDGVAEVAALSVNNLILSSWVQPNPVSACARRCTAFKQKSCLAQSWYCTCTVFIVLYLVVRATDSGSGLAPVIDRSFPPHSLNQQPFCRGCNCKLARRLYIGPSLGAVVFQKLEFKRQNQSIICIFTQ